MDRRAKKLEKKRKNREQVKKKAAAMAARGPSALDIFARSALRAPFGPCFVSATWDDLESPALVSVIVTRQLSGVQFMPVVVVVDRTCLGVKDAFERAPMFRRELDELVDGVGYAHGGMVPCEPILAQSIVFHALDYARELGFEPHRDFRASLFGPRPAELLDTPWCAPDRPIYVVGPYDDVSAIKEQLTRAVGADGFDYVDPSAWPDDDDDLDDVEDADDGELVYSPLQRTVTDGEVSLQICIYRGSSDAGWLLEVEDHLGGSTVWDEQFDTDQAALDAALGSIEQDGFASFVIESGGAGEGPDDSRC